MTLVGYNYYLNGAKINDLPVAPGESFTFEGLASNTAYSITSTAVDAAGNESTSSSVLGTSTLDGTSAGGPVSAADAAAIDAIVAASMADPNSVPQGVIVDLTGPMGTYRKAYGTTGTRPISTDDHFRIGSITKMFVAMAAWIQIDAGTLSLDDTLEQFVPGVPNGNIITMAHLMSMRSGVYDFMSDLFGWQIPYFLFPTGSYTEAQAIALAKGASTGTPGTTYVYDNSNAVLIGAVLENILAKPIKQILHEQIIEPLGMTETQWPGYPGATSVNIQEPNMGNWAFNPDYVQCAGSLTSNINDLTRFAEALRDGDLLSPESQSKWFHEFPTVESLGALSTAPALFGYGYFMMSYGRWFGHGGSCPGGNGYVTACLYDPLTGATITVAENKQTANASGFYVIGRNIADLLYPGSMLSPTYPIPEDVVARPTGASLTATGGTPRVIVELKDKVLTPAGASMSIMGGVPGRESLMPAGASMAITGGTPTVSNIAPVVFDAFSSSIMSLGSSTSHSHTATAGATVIVDTLSTLVPTSVTYDGVAMTLVDSVWFSGVVGSGGGGVMSRYIISGAPTGARTVVVTCSGTTRISTTVTSYVNVGSVGATTQLNSPGATTPSQSATGSPTTLIVQAFGEVSGNGFFTAWSGGTNRGHQSIGDGTYGYCDILVNDTNAATTFTATGPSGCYWGAMATELIAEA